MDLRKLNSLTKYPSIPTYHQLGQNGRIPADAPPQVAFPAGPLSVSEKVDGVNARIIALPKDDYFFGSREELLHARGDRVSSRTLGIVDTLHPIAGRIFPLEYTSGRGLLDAGAAVVFYFEVFGPGTTRAGKSYSETEVRAVLLDIAACPLAMLERELPAISAWRERGLQQFWCRHEASHVAASLGLPIVPERSLIQSGDSDGDSGRLPLTPAAAAEWLARYGTSCVSEREDAAAEGVVVRSDVFGATARVVAKLRFADYRRLADVR